MNKVAGRELTLLIMVMACFGCQRSSSPSNSGTPNAFSSHMENFSLEDQRALNEARLRIDANSIYFFDRQKQSNFLNHILNGNYSIGIGVSYNPRGKLYVIKDEADRPLSSAKLSELRKFAKVSGIEILENGRIPYHFGPDGRTPMIMPSAWEHSEENSRKIVPMTINLNFESPESAKTSIMYIDQKNYSSKQTGHQVQVSFKAPHGAALDEMESFQFLAKRFGGKFESLSE
jgi:hypothetical protein